MSGQLIYGQAWTEFLTLEMAASMLFIHVAIEAKRSNLKLKTRPKQLLDIYHSILHSPADVT